MAKKSAAARAKKHPLMTGLRELRQVMGLTVFEFAKQVGLDYSTLQKYELRSPCTNLPWLWRFAALAADVGRPDLAKLFREAALEPYLTNPEGIIAQTEAQRTPPMALRALERLRDAALSASGDVAAAAGAAAQYLEWRDRADPEDVKRVEAEIRKTLGK